MGLFAVYVNVHLGWTPPSTSLLSAWGLLVAFTTVTLLPFIRNVVPDQEKNCGFSADHVIVILSVCFCSLGVVCIGIAANPFSVIIGFTLFNLGSGYPDSMYGMVMSSGQEIMSMARINMLITLVANFSGVFGAGFGAWVFSKIQESISSSVRMEFLVPGALMMISIAFLCI